MHRVAAVATSCGSVRAPVGASEGIALFAMITERLVARSYEATAVTS